jgi:hypothetical protein
VMAAVENEDNHCDRFRRRKALTYDALLAPAGLICVVILL